METNLSNNPLVRFRHLILTVLTSALSEPKLFSDTGKFRVKFNDKGEFDKDSVVLADMYSEELTSKNPRPIIITNRENTSIDITAIDNLMGKETFLSPSTNRGTTFTSSMLIRCYGRNSVECEDLACTVALIYILFYPHIRAALNIVHQTHPQIGAVIPKETDAKISLYYCDIRVNVMIPYEWTITYTDLEDMAGFATTINIYWDAEANAPRPLDNS